MQAETRTNIQLTSPAKAFNFYADGTSATSKEGTLRGLSDLAEDGTIYLRNIINYLPVNTA
jgi:hypothetical protein